MSASRDTKLMSTAEVEHALAPISWKNPVILTVMAIVGLAFVFFSTGTTTLQLPIWTNDATGALDTSSGPVWEVPAGRGALICVILLFVIAAAVWWLTSQRITMGKWLPILFGVVWVLAFLLWVGAGQSSGIIVTDLMRGAIFLAVPLIFGSMAGAVCEHSGVINVAIEADLLFGAFLAALVGAVTQNAWIGLIAAPVAGALVGCLLALFAVRYWVDHIIVGVVLNVLVLGLTNYLFDIPAVETILNSAGTVAIPRWPIPILSDIPLIGPVLFNATILQYAMYVMVFLLQFMLFHSRWGLRMRACGEHPQAADTVGIKVNRTRIRNAILGSAIAGLGGAALTIASDGVANAFIKNISSGKGYIALAAMILGKWNPVGAALACLLFGFATNAQSALGLVNTSVPTEFMGMAPYVVTVIAVAGVVGRVRAPAMEGTAYRG